MKNTFKLVSCVTAGVALLAAAQLTASAAVPAFSPLAISGTGVGSLAVTDTNTLVTTYSAKNFTLNTAFILGEIYKSDEATNNGWTQAVGDTLAVVNTSQSFTNNGLKIIGYRTLNSRRVPIYAFITNSLVAPYGQDVSAGDVVILNARGQVKADLTQENIVFVGWNAYQTIQVGWARTIQGKLTIDFYFTFGGIEEVIYSDLFGSITSSLPGSNSSTPANKYNWYGNLTLNGGGVGYMSNPDDAALLNGSIIFSRIAAVVPYSIRNSNSY